MKNLSLKTSFFLIFILFSSKIFSQESRFSKEKFISSSGDTLNYRMLYPDADTIRKYPLVIFLHGSGERGNDNESQLKWGVTNFATDEMMRLYPSFVIAPQCPLNINWSNFTKPYNDLDMKLDPTPSKPMASLISLIKNLTVKFNIDTNRIYITGLSMGGFGTFDAIERYPNLFAAAVPVCGGGDLTKVPLIAHIPIWIFHGSEDFVVNTKDALEMTNALFKVGAHPGLTLLPEVGHFSWITAYEDRTMLQWLYRQHK